MRAAARRRPSYALVDLECLARRPEAYSNSTLGAFRRRQYNQPAIATITTMTSTMSSPVLPLLPEVPPVDGADVGAPEAPPVASTVAPGVGTAVASVSSV